jgi:hypothetical protein
VKLSSEISKPKVQAQFAAASAACGQVGWEHRVMGTPVKPFIRNLGLLSGFRDSSIATAKILAAIPDVLINGPATLDHVAKSIASKTSSLEILVRPVIFHALWTKQLTANLNESLSNNTLIMWQEGQ